MSKRSRALVDEIMPQVSGCDTTLCNSAPITYQIIYGKDPELRGFASFTLARTIIASGEPRMCHAPLLSLELTHLLLAGSLSEALPYLLSAEKDYECLDILEAVQDIQYFISVIYHNLNMVNERDAAARRHEITLEKREKVVICTRDEEVEAILDLLGEIGVALSSRK